MLSSKWSRRFPKRRWLRFSLRTVLLVTALIAVGLGLAMNGVARQRRAVRAVREAGGAVIYNLHEVGVAPWWKRQIVGEDSLFSETLTVNLSGTHVGEHVFIALQDLPQVETLHLVGAHLSDAELRQLGKLTNLRDLNLSTATFDQRGLAHLNGLTNLKRLQLGATSITDRGLTLLHPPNLHSLVLNGTQVTNEGVLRFKEILPKCSVTWDKRPRYQPPAEPARGGLGGSSTP